jgi:hypothetical protein
VDDFFILALKAGGELHGEPKLRDPKSGYYSAAVIDFDRNSIEAVYRPESYSASNRSQAAGPSLKVLKNGSMASRSRSVKAESVVPPRSEAKNPSKSAAAAPIESAAPAPAPAPSMAPPMQPIYQIQTKPDDGTKTAKAIVGTLLGAAAGAAVAYAMVKGESQSSAPAMFASPVSAATTAPPYSQQQQQQPSAPIPVPTRAQEPPHYRAIDGPAANSVFSLYSRSAPSKNARAETLYEDNNYYPLETVYSNESAGIRRSSSGSIYGTRDLPIRAIEYAPKTRSRTFPYHPSFISSFADKSRKIDEETEFSESTAKPAKPSHSSSRASHANHSSHTTSHASPHASSHSSHATHTHHGTHSSHHSSRCSHHSSHHSRGTQRTSIRESKSQTDGSSHFNIPLPDGSMATFTAYSNHPKSVRSPRYIPLPESVTNASTIFLDNVDVDTQVTPDDSISQAGGEGRSSPGRSRNSHRSNHSKITSHLSKHSSKFDEPVKPSDSISQVSTNLSRSSDQTMKASGNGGSKARSKTSSRSSLKSSSQR